MIYADENVWRPVMEGLRRRGWEVTSVLDEETLGDSDIEHLEAEIDDAVYDLFDLTAKEKEVIEEYLEVF
jgi:hypothetical protein